MGQSTGREAKGKAGHFLAGKWLAGFPPAPADPFELHHDYDIHQLFASLGLANWLHNRSSLPLVMGPHGIIYTSNTNVFRVEIAATKRRVSFAHLA